MRIQIKAILTLLMLLCINSVHVLAQKSDYVWLSGFDSKDGYSAPFGFYFGASVLDFNYSPRLVSYDSIAMNFDATNTSFCDSNGNLLFYTNGIFIANSLNEKIENSDSLNAGAFFPDIAEYDNRICQGIYTLPLSTQTNQFYLVHSQVDILNGYPVFANILLTKLDMSANIGRGKVVFKNQVLVMTLQEVVWRLPNMEMATVGWCLPFDQTQIVSRQYS